MTLSIFISKIKDYLEWKKFRDEEPFKMKIIDDGEEILVKEVEVKKMINIILRNEIMIVQISIKHLFASWYRLSTS